MYYSKAYYGISSKDVDIVSDQAGCPHGIALGALVECRGDIVDAIMALTVGVWPSMNGELTKAARSGKLTKAAGSVLLVSEEPMESEDSGEMDLPIDF